MGVVISLEGAGSKKRASIEPLVKLTLSDMERVNEAILAHARSAPGCLDFSLSADLLDPSRVNVYERWISRDHLLAYRASDGPALDDSIPVTAADVELHHISASEAP